VKSDRAAAVAAAGGNIAAAAAVVAAVAVAAVAIKRSPVFIERGSDEPGLAFLFGCVLSTVCGMPPLPAGPLSEQVV
jgi:hypothetical protein